LVTVLLAALLLGESFTLGVALGVGLVLGGVLCVVEPETKAHPERARIGLTLTPVIATLCYGVVPVLKKFGLDYGAPPMLGALVMHATGLAMLLAFGRVLKIEFKRQSIPLVSLWCFVAAGVFYASGSILTLKALTHAPASVVAPIWSAQPMVSFLLAKAALKDIEQVTLKDGVAAALVVAGVWVLRGG
jgi:drug/metabolite transporter (DMT)-like permease